VSDVAPPVDPETIALLERLGELAIAAAERRDLRTWEISSVGYLLAIPDHPAFDGLRTSFATSLQNFMRRTPC